MFEPHKRHFKSSSFFFVASDLTNYFSATSAAFITESEPRYTSFLHVIDLVTFDLPSTGTMQRRPAEFAKLFLEVRRTVSTFCSAE